MQKLVDLIDDYIYKKTVSDTLHAKEHYGHFVEPMTMKQADVETRRARNLLVDWELNMEARISSVSS